ncbi:hypothetical protein G7054_g8442 [Neopestalotiopsis clavispora]|nr:hypothetical protein G7054_g8442 [Neopestalotiopsis clavispora]
MAETKTSTTQNGALTPPVKASADQMPPAANAAKAPAGPRGPPLWKVHELPAPIRTFPLPTFYPSNPLSLLHVAYAWFRQVLSPPREPAVVYEGVWSPAHRSVLIRDSKSIRALWEQGFYGKGHLSRSEPNWLRREQARKGAHGDHVAEVFTNKRREERIQMKWERARKEQGAILRTRYEEARIAPVEVAGLLALPNSQRELNVLIYGVDESILSDSVRVVTSNDIDPAIANDQNTHSAPRQNGDVQRPTTPQEKDKLVLDLQDISSDRQASIKRRKSVRFSPKVESTTFQLSDPPSPSQTILGNGNGKIPDGILSSRLATPQDSSQSPVQEHAILQMLNDPGPVESAPKELVDKEHLQLTLEEAMWLSFGMGILDVKDEKTGESISNDSLLRIGREFSYCPPRSSHLQPDDPFLIHYAVYHHFRSLGWVTRPGIKFGCDWLLYHRGPAFSHAEFAVIVLPSYSDPHWRSQGRDTTDKSWHWLHMVNRVQSTALKTLVLVYVDIPPPTKESLDVPSLLKQYKIREVMIRRWLINRNRD